jgi:predicted unusual protein kinase regulating ubiquinone biosynthesis (AarF/ABC1/UbiB family)
MQVQRPDVWAQVQVDLGVLLLLLRLLRWAGRIKQDITLWAGTLGSGLAQELDYQQVSAGNVMQLAFVLCLQCCKSSVQIAQDVGLPAGLPQ